MVSVASPDSKDPAGFVRQNGYNWTFGVAPDAFQLYDIQAFPTTFFIDRKGNVVDSVMGGMEKADFEARLAKII